jgi:hypothetical protein
MSPRRSLPSLVLVALLTTAPAHAQDLRAQAREAFAAAERAFEEHDYELALERFRRAQELHPHDAVRFNVAVCLERLGRFREALDEYAQAAASPVLADTARAEAVRLAERARARLGTLRVTGRPEGALVRVGALRCELPCTLELDPGVHRVLVEGPRTLEREARLERGGATSLEVDAAEIATSTTPTGPALAASAEPTLEHHGFQAFGVLTALGTSLTALGTAGVIGFGLHTEGLAQRYVAGPTVELYDEGTTMRALTNVALAVGAAGLACIAIDLVLALVDPPRTVRLSSRGLHVAF